MEVLIHGLCAGLYIRRDDNMKTNVWKMAGHLRILLLMKCCLRACL